MEETFNRPLSIGFFPSCPPARTTGLALSPSLIAQAHIPPWPRPSEGSPAGTAHVDPEENSQVPADVAAPARPPGGDRVARVGSRRPSYVSRPVPETPGLPYKMAVPFVAVRGAETLSRLWEAR